jgi:TctA family transporter
MLGKKVLLELIGWVITVVVVVLVLLPIYSYIGGNYPFYEENIVFIVIALTFIRYIFLLKHHWLSASKWIKALFFFIPIPLFFYLMGGFYDFQAYSDEVGLGAMLTGLPYEAQSNITKYIRTEMVLFWSAAFLANLAMPLRMLISIWREINKGTH